MFDKSPVIDAIETRKSFRADLLETIGFSPLVPFSAAENLGFQRQRKVWKTMFSWGGSFGLHDVEALVV